MEKQPRYSGGIETRIESDVTNFESQKCRDGAETLRRAGVLLPTAGRTYYHGRAHEGDFAVDAFFKNAGNTTGNANVNVGETVLHVAGTHRTAERFADKRAAKKGTSAEVAEVVIPDQEAAFFDCNLSDASPEVTQERKDAITSTLPPYLAGTTLSAEDYKTIDVEALMGFFRSRASAREKHITADAEIPFVASQLKVSIAGARAIAGAVNTYYYIASRRDPAKGMAKCLLTMVQQEGDLQLLLDDKIALKSEEPAYDKYGHAIERLYPISREYLHKWMRNMHVVGIKADIDSATLGDHIEDAYEIVSLEDARSKEQMERSLEIRHKSYGGAARRIHRLLNNPESMKQPETPLSYLNMDMHVSPAALIDSATRVSPKYQQLFESGTGVKEGFTLRQHTETALEIFDASYKANLPRSVYDFGRLCLLVHDIGKPEAAKRGANQEPFNAKISRDFLRDIHAPKEFADAIPEIITAGAEAASEYMLKKDEGEKKAAKRKLATVSAEIAKKLFNISPMDPMYRSCVQTVFDICYALVICDGGAYTTNASTRAQKGGLEFRHFNTNTYFNKTFKLGQYNPNHIRPR
jgi:hypothetical protein